MFSICATWFFLYSEKMNFYSENWLSNQVLWANSLEFLGHQGRQGIKGVLSEAGIGWAKVLLPLTYYFLYLLASVLISVVSFSEVTLCRMRVKMVSTSRWLHNIKVYILHMLYVHHGTVCILSHHSKLKSRPSEAYWSHGREERNKARTRSWLLKHLLGCGTCCSHRSLPKASHLSII